MNDIKPLGQLPQSIQQGALGVLPIRLKVKVKEDSFLHIGGSPSPLTEKKAPVFSVDGSPVIPASSFKGAFRYQVEQFLINNLESLKKSFQVSDIEHLKPCIPSPNPSKAERELSGYRTKHCELKAEEDRIIAPNEGICPACYFFGATGLQGVLRVPNFFPESGEYRIDQTNIRIDRKTKTAAARAIVTGEQVKPKTVFNGTLEIISKQETFKFGRCRNIGGTDVDFWLKALNNMGLEQVQLLLVNQILIPALNNINVLGGWKSKGGGKIELEISK